MKIFVPGRICLFGEHSDWAGGYRRINADIEKGYTLICGTDQGIHAEVAPHPTSLVLTTTTPDGECLGPYEIPMEPKALLAEAGKGGFWSYAAGVAYPTADWTYDDLRNAAKQLTKDSNGDGKIDQFGFYSDLWDMELIWSEGIWAYGGDFVDKKGMPAFDQPAAGGAGRRGFGILCSLSRCPLRSGRRPPHSAKRRFRIA